MDPSPFCAVCKVEVAGEEVEAECPSYPEQCGAPEREGCTGAQRGRWKSMAAQL